VRPRALTAAFLLLSGLGDAAGGAWAALDWRSCAAFFGHNVPGWQAQKAAVAIAFADAALRQLWVNLGTTLLVLGVAQLLAARWVAQGKEAGDTLARVIALGLLGAAAVLAVFGPQVSSLLTEGVRGLVLLVLVTWTRTAEAPSPAAGAAGLD